MDTYVDNVLPLALRWLEQGERVALATVVQTWGSSPRQTGSQLAVNAAGEFQGSVSGGCVEGAVISTAKNVMTSGRAELAEFSVSDDQAWDVGLACGGTVRIYVEPLCERRIVTAGQIASQIEQGLGAILVTRLSTSEQQLLSADAPEDWPVELASEIADAVVADRSKTVVVGDQEWFIHLFSPPLTMVVLGAVHITQALVPVASLCGYQVRVIDPRRAFTTENRFPGVEYFAQWPQQVLEQVKVDRRTAFVALTHDPKIDDPGLQVALASDAFYIGALGSRKTQQARRQRLADSGFGPADLDRIKGPVGLDIGAASPAEIAIAIMAEITQVLRQPTR
ncbi:MAG: XdhC family protein [Gammaproteobacteria bacterium]|nr:XdhC family protein [Gammaproteobacteria bacterium]